ncbi:unnamed protein product, partial [Rotaria sp. Silwood1]
MKDLRKQAADYNRQSGKIDEQCLFYETKKNLEQYCDEIENTDVWGGEPEILAIAELYETSVRVIRIDPQQSCVSISEFPSNQTSFKKCCYIILNNNHYESLHLPIDQLIAAANLIDMISTSLSNKRKFQEHDKHTSMEVTTKKLASSIVNTNEVGVPTLTYSCSIPTKKNNNSSGNIKEHPQSDVSQIRFKVELAKRFRARYLTDYEPKNAYKRD